MQRRLDRTRGERQPATRSLISPACASSSRPRAPLLASSGVSARQGTAAVAPAERLRQCWSWRVARRVAFDENFLAQSSTRRSQSSLGCCRVRRVPCRYFADSPFLVLISRSPTQSRRPADQLVTTRSPSLATHESRRQLTRRRRATLYQCARRTVRLFAIKPDPSYHGIYSTNSLLRPYFKLHHPATIASLRLRFTLVQRRPQLSQLSQHSTHHFAATRTTFRHLACVQPVLLGPRDLGAPPRFRFERSK